MGFTRWVMPPWLFCPPRLQRGFFFWTTVVWTRIRDHRFRCELSEGGVILGNIPGHRPRLQMGYSARPAWKPRLAAGEPNPQGRAVKLRNRNFRFLKCIFHFSGRHRGKRQAAPERT